MTEVRIEISPAGRGAMTGRGQGGTSGELVIFYFSTWMLVIMISSLSCTLTVCALYCVHAMLLEKVYFKIIFTELLTPKYKI